MKRLASLVLMAALAACSSQPEKKPDQTTVHEIMLSQVDKHADELWELTNLAIGDSGGLDPAKMDDAKWAELVRLATEVQTGAEQLAKLDPLVAAKPGVKIADEGVPGGDSVESVQANLDKNPQSFRDFANTLAGHMRDMATAAKRTTRQRSAHWSISSTRYAKAATSTTGIRRRRCWSNSTSTRA